ncbi:MAG: sulfatase [Pseudomonadota bacterium]
MRPHLFALALCSLLACGTEAPQGPVLPAAVLAPPPAPGAPPNVVVVVLDTLRADHLGCYGYGRPTTPRIDAFAAGATRYVHALASAPWTLPSHASMLTGQAPWQHGAHSYDLDAPADDNTRGISGDALTLTEHLAGHGYATGAFLANEAFLAKRYHLDQGFGTYHLEHVTAAQLNPRVLGWVDEHAGGPFFLLVNFMDVHSPLNTARRAGFLEGVAGGSSNRLVHSLRAPVMAGRGAWPEKKLARLVDMYDLALANLDEQVGVLLDAFAQRGLTDRTLFVVVSDHGAYFGEHRLLGHSKDVYRQAMEVPLIIRAPGQAAGETVDTEVTSADLPALILGRLDPPLDAESPFPPSDAALGALGENYYARPKDLFGVPWGDRFHRVRRSLVRWPWKLIQSSDGQHELYDLSQDPAEADNLFPARPDIAAPMLVAIEEVVAQAAPDAGLDPVAPLSEAEKRALQALGYMDEGGE